jgi:GntR family transcriptional regulator
MFVAEGATARLRASARKEFLEESWPAIAAHMRRLDLEVRDLVERALA